MKNIFLFRKSKPSFAIKVLILFLAILVSLMFFKAENVSSSDVIIEKISVNALGEEGNGTSFAPSVSRDGRYVVFASEADNLVPDDLNFSIDIFLFDRQLSTIKRISLTDTGDEAAGSSQSAIISADGNFVVFNSASELVQGSPAGIFVYNVQTEEIEFIAPGQFPDISEDGRFITFISSDDSLVPDDNNGVDDAFVFDRQTQDIERISVNSLGEESNGESTLVSISANGRYVAFSSSGSNLVPGDTNDGADIFVFDRQTGEIERVSVSNLGDEDNGLPYGPSISANGRYVVFTSTGTNLVPDDNNGTTDVFMFDRQTGEIERVSVNGLGEEGNGFSYVLHPKSISENGRHIAYISAATNLVPGDSNGLTDVFVFDRQVNNVSRMNLNSQEDEAEGGPMGFSSSISSGGDFVVFESYSTNLVAGVSSGDFTQIYLRQRFDPNNDPTDINISNSEILEGLSVGTLIGNLTTVDIDFGDSHTYSLLCDAPQGDEDSFSIQGSQLLSAEVYDFSVKDSYSICIRTDDGNGGTFDKNFTISILESQSPPPSSSGGGSTGGTLLGCKDEDATNYNPFSFHSQDLCEYGSAGVGNASNNQPGDVKVQLESFGVKCPFFSRYLKLGDKNGDVLLMQAFLVSQGISPGPVDGIFGKKTQTAVKAFQTRYFEEVLKPWGLNRATGWWYQTTRKKANELSGCYMQSPLILDNGVILN